MGGSRLGGWGGGAVVNESEAGGAGGGHKVFSLSRLRASELYGKRGNPVKMFLRLEFISFGYYVVTFELELALKCITLRLHLYYLKIYRKTKRGMG